MTIVHITSDYPDGFQPNKTKAISNLVAHSAADFDHLVYSLNRQNISAFHAVSRNMRRGDNKWDAGAFAIDINVQTWTYRAPSKGLFMKSIFDQIADRIIGDLEKSGRTISLVQGHKLSMEAIIADRIARHFDVPLAVSIQGNTDQTIIGIRRDLRSLYRRIFHQAAVIFPFAPWALDYCESIFGPREKPTVMLPCITDQDQIITPRIRPPHLMTAFHLEHWRLKNLSGLINAGRKLAEEHPEIRMDIFGGGSEQIVQEIMAANGPLKHGFATLHGKLAASEMQQMMNNHAGFALLSRRESYGMVFAEALLAGCPIIYPKGAAVDGYFPDMSFAIAAPWHDKAAITDAMSRLLKDQMQIKSDLAEWQKSGAAAQFQKKNIAAAYRNGLSSALSDKPSHAIA